MTFPRHTYLNLEDLMLREFAATDPQGFLRQYKAPVIIDEIQRCPDLLSQIQVMVDAQKKTGQYVLTGSHNFLLINSVSQSLAGRTGILTLLPLTIDEVKKFDGKQSLDELLQSGFYPGIYDKKIGASILLSDYLATYIERDVRQMQNIKNLSTFQKFIGLCAGRVGQLLNLSNLANEVGVSSTTLGQWLSVLEASYLIFLLKPYHANTNKRLVKTPKLYFYDVGLASFLLGIRNPAQLRNHPLRGALFENMVVQEWIKRNYNAGTFNQFYFYRDQSGNEVDLIVDEGNRLKLIEIKSSQTPTSAFFKGHDYFLKTIKTHFHVEKLVIYAGQDVQTRSEGKIVPFHYQ